MTGRKVIRRVTIAEDDTPDPDPEKVAECLEEIEAAGKARRGSGSYELHQRYLRQIMRVCGSNIIDLDDEERAQIWDEVAGESQRLRPLEEIMTTTDRETAEEIRERVLAAYDYDESEAVADGALEWRRTRKRKRR